jgi:4'-phosphopantetheinyl transferase
MPSRIFPLPLGRVEVWWARLDSPEKQESDHPDDLNEARQITGTDRPRAFLVSRTILRDLLGDYIGSLPEAVELRRDAPEARPYVAGKPDLSFSIARRWPIAVFAFACGRAVGVDLEKTADVERQGALPDSFLSSAERGVIAKIPQPERRLDVLKRWALKEAIAKGTGLGARLPFAEIDLGPRAPGATARIACPGWPEGWQAAILPAAPGLVAAVAVQGEWTDLVQSQAPCKLKKVAHYGRPTEPLVTAKRPGLRDARPDNAATSRPPPNASR